MARFDVYRIDDGYVLDCQADLLRDLATRFVVPLLPIERAPRPAGRLNPIFDIEGVSHVMATQFAAAIEVRELAGKVTSFSMHDREIGNALDLLLNGV